MTISLSRYFSILGLLFHVIVANVCAEDDIPALSLEKFGVMFAGGTTEVVDHPCLGTLLPCPGPGTVSHGYSPVYYFIPSEQDFPIPIIMVPGFTLPVTYFMGTTNGQEGWAQFFARRGAAVYVTSQINTIDGGLNTSPFNAVKKGLAPPASQPELFRFTPELYWSIFGYGPEYPELWPDVQFDINDMPALLTGVSVADVSLDPVEPRADALISLLAQVGPAILFTHSQSGASGFDVAQRRPDLLRGIVSVEPVGCAGDALATNQESLSIPILILFGDRLDTRDIFKQSAQDCADTVNKIRQAGGVAETIRLNEDAGIIGNTHMTMVDDNSHEIATLVLDWLFKHVVEN
jgi:pimeloyl-ACP methyl ester carboxylesterase